jgi:hypothetical protein
MIKTLPYPKRLEVSCGLHCFATVVVRFESLWCGLRAVNHFFGGHTLPQSFQAKAFPLEEDGDDEMAVICGILY